MSGQAASSIFLHGVQGAKINPQVNHVLGLKRKEEGKGGEGGLGNLLVSAHDGVCINELQVGNRGWKQVYNGVLLE